MPFSENFNTLWLKKQNVLLKAKTSVSQVKYGSQWSYLPDFSQQLADYEILRFIATEKGHAYAFSNYYSSRYLFIAEIHLGSLPSKRSRKRKKFVLHEVVSGRLIASTRRFISA